MARRFFLLVLIISWLAANLAFGDDWQFHALGNLGGNDGFGKSSQALGVSGDGRYVVGDSLATAGLGITTGTEALRWTKPNTRTQIGALTKKSPYSSAKAVSLRGRIVVGESQTAERKRAFRWSEADGIVSLGVLQGHDESAAWDVTGDGEIIVGKSSSLSEELAFRWTKGTMVSLGDLPGGEKESIALAISLDGSKIVGYSSSKNGTEAFSWTPDGMRGLGSLPGDRFASRAFAVSADGKVIVGDSLSRRGAEAFRWTQQTGMQPLGDISGGGFQSKATGVSADGNTIVGTATSENGSEAFVWTPENNIQSLSHLLRQKGLSEGWRLQEACGISSDGAVIVGIGQNPSGEIAGWIIERTKIAPSGEAGH